MAWGVLRVGVAGVCFSRWDREESLCPLPHFCYLKGDGKDFETAKNPGRCGTGFACAFCGGIPVFRWCGAISISGPYSNAGSSGPGGTMEAGRLYFSFKEHLAPLACPHGAPQHPIHCLGFPALALRRKYPLCESGQPRDRSQSRRFSTPVRFRPFCLRGQQCHLQRAEAERLRRDAPLARDKIRPQPG